MISKKASLTYYGLLLALSFNGLSAFTSVLVQAKEDEEGGTDAEYDEPISGPKSPFAVDFDSHRDLGVSETAIGGKVSEKDGLSGPSGELMELGSNNNKANKEENPSTLVPLMFRHGSPPWNINKHKPLEENQSPLGILKPFDRRRDLQEYVHISRTHSGAESDANIGKATA